MITPISNAECLFCAGRGSTSPIAHDPNDYMEPCAACKGTGRADSPELWKAKETPPEAKPVKITDDRSGFNKLPITERLYQRTGIEWRMIRVDDETKIYKPRNASENPHRVQIIHRYSNRYCWKLMAASTEISACGVLKVLYPEIRRALNGEGIPACSI